MATFSGAALEEKKNFPNEILFSKSFFDHAEVYDKSVMGTALQQAEVFYGYSSLVLSPPQNKYILSQCFIHCNGNGYWTVPDFL